MRSLPRKRGRPGRASSSMAPASAASPANTARQPSHSHTSMPAGTPSTSEPLMPTKITPMARPRCRGGTMRVAISVATRHVSALAAAMPMRAASSSA